MSEFPPRVCLDSSAVRRFREEKKLTQLYVSKVVGVTTDTISRWENNRYPSVLRENALRLAEALEVDVALILEKDGELCSLDHDIPAISTRNRGKRLWWLLLLPVLLLGFIFYQRNQPQPPVFSLAAERWVPRYAAPGSVIPVYLLLDSDVGHKGFILREHFPVGWTLIEASPPPSSLDNEQGNARWIVKPGETRPVISYLLRVDKGSPSNAQATLRGELVVGQESRSVPVSVSGGDQMTVASYQWADLNGDSRIDDGEMLMASDVFDVVKGVHLDWDSLEKLWDSGRYRWDESAARFLPVKNVPVSDVGR